jgi:hypothetical protein
VNGGAYYRFKLAPPESNFYTIQRYDYVSLKLCLLSILWKMSVSNRDAFKSVQLGPFEATIRKMLLAKNPGRVDEFPTVIVRIVGEIDSSTLRPTVPIKIEGSMFMSLGCPATWRLSKLTSDQHHSRLGT